MPDRATIRGRRDRAILEVLARAGLRRSEPCALRWDDVVEVPRWPDARLRDAVAERPAEETAWALRIEHSKRGRSRLVPLTRPVVTALQARKATSVGARARTRGSRPRLLVSCSSASHARASRTARRWRPGRSARSSAATPPRPTCHPGCARHTCCATRAAPHVLRHTFCTAIARARGPGRRGRARRPRRRAHLQAPRHRHRRPHPDGDRPCLRLGHLRRRLGVARDLTGPASGDDQMSAASGAIGRLAPPIEARRAVACVERRPGR
jgi:integrase